MGMSEYRKDRRPAARPFSQKRSFLSTAFLFSSNLKAGQASSAPPSGVRNGSAFPNDRFILVPEAVPPSAGLRRSLKENMKDHPRKGVAIPQTGGQALDGRSGRYIDAITALISPYE
jgi:hypothetical protein